MLSLKPYYDIHTARHARFSKKYSAKKAIKLANTYKGRVTLFADYYKGWYLAPLKKNLREGTALITTHILLSFCEIIEQFKKGTKSSSSTTGNFIKNTLKTMYQENWPKNVSTKVIDSLIKNIFEILRNGLHHDLTPRGIHIFLSDGITLAYQQNSIGNITELWFNPRDFLRIIEVHFQNYIDELKNKSNISLVNNFEIMFSKVFQL